MKNFAVRAGVLLLALAIPQAVQGWIQYLDGSVLPDFPWIPFQDGPPEGRGDTVVVDFPDPDGGAANQALRVNSGDGGNEWYVGPLYLNEIVAAARFRLVEFSPAGRENLLCVQVGGAGSPAPAGFILLGG